MKKVIAIFTVILMISSHCIATNTYSAYLESNCYYIQTINEISDDEVSEMMNQLGITDLLHKYQDAIVFRLKEEKHTYYVEIVDLFDELKKDPNIDKELFNKLSEATNYYLDLIHYMQETGINEAIYQYSIACKNGSKNDAVYNLGKIDGLIDSLEKENKLDASTIDLIEYFADGYIDLIDYSYTNNSHKSTNQVASNTQKTNSKNSSKQALAKSNKKSSESKREKKVTMDDVTDKLDKANNLLDGLIRLAQNAQTIYNAVKRN